MVPNNLTIAVFRGCDFSGYSEAYEAGAVYSSKVAVSEAMLNTEGFADAVLQTITATEKAINNGQSDMEAVLVDVEQPHKVWAHLHDYLRLEKQYKPDAALDIVGPKPEPTQVNSPPAPSSTMSAVDLEVLLQASYRAADFLDELSPAKQKSFRKLVLMDLVLPRGEGLTLLGEAYVQSLKALPILPPPPVATALTPRPQRAWVNQPSSLQPCHKDNGRNVLVLDDGGSALDVYFTDGDVISARLPRNSLSIGSWRPEPNFEAFTTGQGHVVKKWPSNEDHFIAIDKNSQSVEAKGNAKELLDTLSENYSTAQIREIIEVYELGRECTLHMVLTPEKD